MGQSSMRVTAIYRPGLSNCMCMVDRGVISWTGRPSRFDSPCDLTRGTGFGLEVAGIDRASQRRMRHTQPGADLRHHCCFRRAFRSQPVIDRRRRDPAGQRGLREKQQCKAVRPARDGKAQPPFARP